MTEATAPGQKKDDILATLLRRGLDENKFNVPIKDLHQDERSRIASAIAERYVDNRELLREKLENGEHLEVVGEEQLDSLVTARTPADVLLRVVAKKASIRRLQVPRVRELMPLEVYTQLTDDSYIVPRMSKALHQLLAVRDELDGQSLISSPFDVAGAWFVRNSRKKDQPLSEDDGCYLIFHPAKGDGETLTGLGAGDRKHKERLPIVFKFDSDGNITNIFKHEDVGGRKLDDSIVQAHIDITTPLERYFTSMTFIPAEFKDGRAEMLGKADEVADAGEIVGSVSSQTSPITGKRLNISVYELKTPEDVKAIGLNSNRIGVVKDEHSTILGLVSVCDGPCPEDVVGGTPVAYHIEVKDVGVRPKSTLESEIHELAVQEHLWRFGEPRMSFSERIGETRKVLDELANACEPEILADHDEQVRTKIRFLTRLSPAVPYLIRLKSELPEKIAGREGGENGRLNELLGASYAQLFQAAAMMVGRGRAVNILWPLETTDNFLQGYLEYLQVGERAYAMSVGKIVEEKLRPIWVDSRENWRNIVHTLQREGVRTREHVSFEAKNIRREITQTQDVVARHFDRIEGGEQYVQEIADALPEMRDVLDAIGADTTKIKAALEAPKDRTKLLLEAGISSFLGGVKLRREINLGRVDDSVIRGKKRIKEDVRQGRMGDGDKDKLSNAVGRIGGVLRKIVQKIKGFEDVPPADIDKLNELLAYDALKNQ